MTLGGEPGPAGLPTVGRPEPAAVERMFTAIAWRYDLVNLVLSQAQDRRWRRRAAQLARVAAGDRALDVCTGTGALARLLRRRVGPAGEVVGIDLTPAMIDFARRRGSSVRYLVGDATQIPFPDGYFDAATVAFGLRNIADPEAALAELARVVRPGGRVVILEFSTVKWPLRAAYRWYSRALIPRLARLLLGRDEAYRYLTESIAAFPPPRTVSGWLSRSGLRAERARTMTGGVVAIHVGVRPRQAPAVSALVPPEGSGSESRRPAPAAPRPRAGRSAGRSPAPPAEGGHGP